MHPYHARPRPVAFLPTLSPLASLLLLLENVHHCNELTRRHKGFQPQFKKVVFSSMISLSIFKHLRDMIPSNLYIFRLTSCSSHAQNPSCPSIFKLKLENLWSSLLLSFILDVLSLGVTDFSYILDC